MTTQEMLNELQEKFGRMGHPLTVTDFSEITSDFSGNLLRDQPRKTVEILYNLLILESNKNYL